MYIDYVSIAAGAALLAFSFILAAILFRSRRQGQEYQRFLADETQHIDVVSTLSSTLNRTQPLGTERLVNFTFSTEVLSTEPIGEIGTQPLNSYSTKPLARTEVLSLETSEHFTAIERPDQKTPSQFSEAETEELQTVGGELVGVDLDLSLLNDKYRLLREIQGGGMSRIFLARHKKLGNEWIIKFVDGSQAELANEAEVLKKLNHISLPQIIDIFQSSQGTFLVERYIEGCPLNEAFKLKDQLKEGQISDWGLQLAQVLHYLHSLDTPIIHCDLKPSNIMVTHDNRLVLIDFGISKRQGVDEKNLGITYRYAAPEQFRGNAAHTDTVRQRFGVLPPDHEHWPIDQRTDLYSVGVILYELIMGRIPEEGKTEDIHYRATSKLANAICRCLEIRPDQRFQSAKELAQALQEVEEQKLHITKKLMLRRVAAVCCGIFLVSGMVISASGVYINRMENMSIVSMDPGYAAVTVQQSVQILVQKTKSNGEITVLEADKIRWSYSDENIARLDGDRLVGINVGETTLYGQYRNKVITLDVTVTEPVGEMTAIALRYIDGVDVSVYAGTGNRELEDGNVKDCSFVSPESLSIDGDVLWVSDSGMVRLIEDGEVSTMYLEPAFLTADLVQGWDGELYILTGPWETEDEESYYGFLRIGEEGAKFLYYTEAAWSVTTDFAFSSDGALWFIQENMGTGSTSLNVLDMDTLESRWVMDLPESACGMAFDENDNLYLCVPDTGVILRIGKGEENWTYFAGVEGERNFIDGAIPNFYRPTALAAEGDIIYVLDFDTVRKITVEGEGALFTETVVGIPTEDTNPDVTLGLGMETILPASELADIVVDGAGRILLSDSKNSVIYKIVS